VKGRCVELHLKEDKWNNIVQSYCVHLRKTATETRYITQEDCHKEGITCCNVFSWHKIFSKCSESIQPSVSWSKILMNTVIIQENHDIAVTKHADFINFSRKCIVSHAYWLRDEMNVINAPSNGTLRTYFFISLTNLECLIINHYQAWN